MSAKTDDKRAKRQAELLFEKASTCGVPMPDLIDAFPGVGFKRDGLCITEPACLNCGSVFAHENGGAHIAEAGHIETRRTGSSLRIVEHHPAIIPGQSHTMTTGTMFCASGDKHCEFKLTTKSLLQLALDSVEAAEFVKRMGEIVPADYIPRENEWWFAYSATDPDKRAAFSRGKPDDAYRELELGAGVKVLVQSAIGFTAGDAAKALKLNAWAPRMTDERGNVEGSLDYDEARAAELERLAAAKRESEIRRELAETERRLRANKH